MKHNLLKSVILSVILLMGVSNMWAWNPVYLIGDPTNNWSSNKTSYVISNNKDEASAYFYFAKNNYFAVYIGYYSEQAGPDSNGAEMNTGASGKQFFIWGDGANSNSAKYVGNNGIVEVHAKQKDYGDDRPWIWLTRPEIKVKHDWNGGGWTEQTMIDNSDGTYSYTGLYSGANQTNFGLGSDGKTMKYITNATLVGSPSKGNKCLFTYNSAGYKGYGTETQNTGSATITRLYTITYNGNGHTGGTVPAAIDKKHETNITLSSSTPTRTGYTFAGWNTKADGSGTDYAKGATYSANADVTLYAKWTAHTYTVKFNANGGTGTMANQSFTYGVEQKLTANSFTRTGYSFNSWNTNTGGTGTKYTNQQSVKNLTSTNNETVNLYAQWTENKYNVIISTEGNGITNQTGTKSVGIEGITITATPNTGNAFKQWNVTGGAKVASTTSASTTVTATAAGTVTAVFAELPANTVYLKPVEWANDGARFAVYAFHNNASNGEWYDMTLVGCTDYYKCDIPAKYTQFSFCRMDPKKGNDWSNKWNQTNDFAIATYKNQVFTHTTWGQDGGKCTGNWAAYKPTITLTLKSSTNGIYRVRNNGNTYVSSLTEDVVVELPINTEINIAEEGAHVPNHGYKLKQCFIQIGNNEKEEATIETKKYGLCGSTTISANFVTEEANAVYFKPNANWTSSSAKFAVYLYDEAGEDTWINLTQDAGGYYTCVIPEGWSNLIFVRLNPKGSGLNWDSDWNQTYSHHIPVTRYNAYTLHADKWGKDENEGWWSQPEATNGDYRLLYVEQVVEKEDWKTVINRTKQHPSDIIKKRSAAGSDIVSLHIYTQGDNPEVILQQYNGSKWVDIEAHMVNGPLEALPGTAMLPGRKNASPDSDKDDFVYDDGIEVIKTDDEDAGCGVWNFTIVQDGSTATLDLTENGLKRYEGKYYIRTDASAGGWSSYTIPANYMTFSSYSKTHSDFSHYYCQWILEGTNVKFTIANDYGYAISDTLDGDSFVPKDGAYVGTLSEKANIRFSWNQVNNNIYRAYIKGAYDPDTDERLRNIVATYKTASGAANKEVILDDSGNWIYQTDITDVKVGSSLESLIAEYRAVQQIFEENIPMLTGGDPNNPDNTYTVRILYDFKIDKTLVTLVPNNNKADISIDVLIERVDQGGATQVQTPINAARTQEGSTVYAVMSFTQDHIESPSKTEWERLYYWVSFPFDVRISEVFGFGEYGEHWIMQYYDGEERAAKGCWIDSPTYWRFITDTTGNDWTNGVLKANKGYVLALTTDIADLNIFQHTDKVSLYFPSTTLISNINDEVINTTVELEPYTCTIERNNRYLYDSNWHIIGIPSYANKNQTLEQNNLFYFYTYNTANNTYSVTTADPRDKEETAGSNVIFKSMHSYMVQFAGTINWKAEWQLNAQQLAARKTESAYNTHSLRLELQQNGTLADKTFIKLQDTDGITNEFDLNIDLTKIINSGANIYTLAGKELIQLAGNVLPIEETIIPIGIQLNAAGEYTFAMPDGTDGIVVELIDYETNTTTNLLLDNYTVNLGKGTFDNRFALHVQPSKVTTSVEDINTNSNGVKKYLIDGILYMQKDGVLYDAQGRCVR